MTDIYKSLEKDLRLHARAIGLPDGAAEIFIAETIKSTRAALTHKSIITDQDLKRVVTKELKKYNKDFAYVYKNCDIII